MWRRVLPHPVLCPPPGGAPDRAPLPPTCVRMRPTYQPNNNLRPPLSTDAHTSTGVVLQDVSGLNTTKDELMTLSSERSKLQDVLRDLQRKKADIEERSRRAKVHRRQWLGRLVPLSSDWALWRRHEVVGHSGIF